MTELDPDSVHIWHVDLDVTDRLCEELRSVLTDDERRRADRFRMDRPRRQYTVARGTLRRVLARYLHEPPTDIRLTYDPHGKPRLVDASDGGGLCFNVSHSHDLALLAVARRQVGVDVEYTHRQTRHEALASRFFSPYEVSALERLSPDRRRAAFFACWTRKEAFLKAKGAGLQLPLNQFDVSIDPNEPAQLLRVGWEPVEARRWRLYDIEVSQGYAAALAAEGPAATIHDRSTPD